ncbi:WDR93 protein, partial [Anseranas semipalmata]|nr:WDR93 protein [Anseranas semipalmata]
LLFQALVFSWNGTVSLMNTATSQIVCCFNSPPSHAVASPWQPVFTLDTVNWCLLLRGDEQQQADALAQSRASHGTIFLFYFNFYPLEEAFPKKPDLPFQSLQDLSLFERCNIFLRDRMAGTVLTPSSSPARQQRLLGLKEQLPDYWSRLQAQAAAMDQERSQKIKGQKKP